jgi:DNA-binding MarR family transcriptional regulator
MSMRIPSLSGEPRRPNLAVLLREAFIALNDLAIERLATSGHDAIRSAHSTVFQYVDDTGTTVSTLAERAQMTKQAMAELVQHLEAHGYVRRAPDPRDRRAKLVLLTDRGEEVMSMARQLGMDVDRRIGELLGEARQHQLEQELDTIRAAARTLL